MSKGIFLGISTKQVWDKKPADCSTCTGCHQMIVSAKYVLSVETTMGMKKETIPTSTQLCESCFSALKPDQK